MNTIYTNGVNSIAPTVVLDLAEAEDMAQYMAQCGYRSKVLTGKRSGTKIRLTYARQDTLDYLLNDWQGGALRGLWTVETKGIHTFLIRTDKPKPTDDDDPTAEPVIEVEDNDSEDEAAEPVAEVEAIEAISDSPAGESVSHSELEPVSMNTMRRKRVTLADIHIDADLLDKYALAVELFDESVEESLEAHLLAVVERAQRASSRRAQKVAKLRSLIEACSSNDFDDDDLDLALDEIERA